MVNNKYVVSDEKVPLRWDYGPISFGLVLSGAVVSWSGPFSRDLLIGRCWEGIFLYPSQCLSDEELRGDPLPLFPSTLGDVYAVPMDWNRDGNDDILATNRTGFLYLLKRKGIYPSISFEIEALVLDKTHGLPFNIPYENPNHPVLDDLGGYFDRAFFNYICPVLYPPSSVTGRTVPLDLIIGDWAGNLWWLQDHSDGRGAPDYRGQPYEKRQEDVVTKRGKELISQHGWMYAKPEERIGDEEGRAFLLGIGSDTGGVRFEGGNTRPVIYRNEQTGSYDLLVLAGTLGDRLYYLQRANPVSERKPVFRNLGEVTINGLEIANEILNMHSKLIVNHQGGWNDLLLSLGGRLALLRNRRSNTVKPEFEFSHIFRAKDAMAGCNYIGEILRDAEGKRHTLESGGNTFETREVKGCAESIRLSAKARLVRDQHGVFRVKGETDPQGGEDWGWHRAARWDFDGSGRQHLIVGTDKGLLYLLIDEGKTGESGQFVFRSVGPLKDRTGTVIKIHNRSVAAGIDLDGDGREDLVVGGCSYQAGIARDPSPGGGLYFILNLGLDEEGLPILGVPGVLETEGYTYDRSRMNSHVFLQVVDLDDDGAKEVLVSIQWHDPGILHVFKPSEGRVRLADTGITIPQSRPIEEWLLDIDGDGELEVVFSGSEIGVGYYRKFKRARRAAERNA